MYQKSLFFSLGCCSVTKIHAPKGNTMSVKRRFRPIFFVACCVGLLVSILAEPSHAQIRIVMSNDNSALGLKGKTFELFKSEIEKRLGSKVVVEMHHSGTLFNQNTQLQGVQLGSAQFIAPGGGI